MPLRPPKSCYPILDMCNIGTFFCLNGVSISGGSPHSGTFSSLSGRALSSTSSFFLPDRNTVTHSTGGSEMMWLGARSVLAPFASVAVTEAAHKETEALLENE